MLYNIYRITAKIRRKNEFKSKNDIVNNASKDLVKKMAARLKLKSLMNNISIALKF
jgi:hypothetical protein